MLRRLQLAVLGTILVYLALSLVYIGTEESQQQSSQTRQPNSLLLESPKQRLPSSSVLKRSRLVSLRSMRNNGDNATERISTSGVPESRPRRTFSRPFRVDAEDNNPNLPPLASLYDSQGNVTGDVQFLLDFAIVGFGKCGAYQVDGSCLATITPCSWSTACLDLTTCANASHLTFSRSDR
jgi:hypothetical protein